MKNSIRPLSLILLAGGLMAGTSACSIMKKEAVKVQDTAKETVEKVETAVASNSHDTDALLGEWSITEVEGKTVVVNGENHPKITLAQAPGQNDVLRVIGFNGCNYLNGDWRLKGHSIVPQGEFISSLRACPDAPYEQDVNIALNSVASYSTTDADNLELKASDGRIVMKLRSRNLSFLNGAWKVSKLNGHDVPASADLRIVLDIEEGRIHGHAGCNILNGTLLVNLDKGNALEFKNLLTSRMTCPDIATEQEFLLALEEVDTATRGESASEALLKDAQGKTVIALTRLAPDSITDIEE